MAHHIWDRRRTAQGADRTDERGAAVSNQCSLNMLPSGNMYERALAKANTEYESLDWAVRIAGCRMLTPGELEIAFVVPGESGELRASLDRLPGPEEVQSVAENCVAFAQLELCPVYMSEAMWDDASAEWAYND